MLDLVARGDILDALIEKGQKSKRYKWGESWELNLSEIKEAVESVPSAEPERIIKIGQRSGKTLESAINYLQSVGWLQEHDRILTESAEPEKKKGKWSNYKDEHCCSVCHCVVISDCWDDEIQYDYCPYCGAEME